MEIKSSGVPGQTYFLQASSDLQAWAPIGTNDADANGTVTFQDSNATNYVSRFYRAATQ
jgi:hypothetical protein